MAFYHALHHILFINKKESELDSLSPTVDEITAASPCMSEERCIAHIAVRILEGWQHTRHSPIWGRHLREYHPPIHPHG